MCVCVCVCVCCCCCTQGVAEEEEEEEEEAVFTRLYAEFLHQKQRMEEEKRVCLQQFQEKLDKARPTYTKVFFFFFTTHTLPSYILLKQPYDSYYVHMLYTSEFHPIWLNPSAVASFI